MKKVFALLLVVAVMFTFVACGEESEFEDKAVDAVNTYYDAFCLTLEGLYDYDEASHNEPEVEETEKLRDGAYKISGTITGKIDNGSVNKKWSAKWSLTVVKTESGELKISGNPDYGEIEF